jgi:hypothetical protein
MYLKGRPVENTPFSMDIRTAAFLVAIVLQGAAPQDVGQTFSASGSRGAARPETRINKMYGTHRIGLGAEF